MAAGVDEKTWRFSVEFFRSLGMAERHGGVVAFVRDLSKRYEVFIHFS